LGITIILCNIGGYIVNIISPTPSSYVYILMLGPLFFAFGIIMLVIGLITGIKSDLENKKKIKKEMIDSRDYDKNFFEIEGMVNYYLKQNEGDAYTAKSLVTKLEHNLEDVKKREYFRNNIKNILNRMARRETIQQKQEEGEIYYFF